MAPMRGLFFALSSTDKDKPGDVVLQEVALLREGLLELRQRTSGIFDLSSGALDKMDLGEKEPPGDDLSQRVKSLEDEIVELKEQLESARVVVGGVSFNSKPQAQAWLIQTGGLASDFVLLALDPCSFLAWAHVSAEGALKYAKLAKDANFESAQEAKVLTLFDYDLPIFWGKDSASGVSRDDRVVPGLPNYMAWENKKVLSGLRFELKRLIKDS